MKTIYYLLIFFIWLSTAKAQCPEGWYALYCRGGAGFTLKNTTPGGNKDYTNLKGKFKKNSNPYSVYGGRGIQPGSCAWYDRIIGVDEPSEFQLSVYLNTMNTQVSMNLLTQCIPSSNCWITLCSVNYGVGYLSIFGTEISTTFGAAPP